MKKTVIILASLLLTISLASCEPFLSAFTRESTPSVEQSTTESASTGGNISTGGTSSSTSTGGNTSTGGGVSADSSEWSSLANGYYANVGETDVLGDLHDLIAFTHTTYTNYGQSRGPNSGDTLKVDYDPENPSSKIIMFYSHASIPAEWNADLYNREHLWCQSLSSGLWEDTDNSTRGGGADMHHVRPVFKSINSSRQNTKYGEVTGSYGTSDYTYNGVNYIGGYYNGETRWEPVDHAKGDVARIILYVYVHYNSPAYLKTGTATSRYFGNLPITNVMAYSSASEAFKLLLKWNEEDPVDQLEINRNEAVYKIQGNRNPFIDYPNFANIIWG